METNREINVENGEVLYGNISSIPVYTNYVRVANMMSNDACVEMRCFDDRDIYSESIVLSETLRQEKS